MQENWKTDNAAGMVRTKMYNSHYEHIFLTLYFIDYILLVLLEYHEKVACNAALGESADVDSVLVLYLEDDELAAAG